MADDDTNQPPPYEGRNLFLTDASLQDAVAREGAGWARERLSAWGGLLGRSETHALAASSIAANGAGPMPAPDHRSGTSEPTWWPGRCG